MATGTTELFERGPHRLDWEHGLERVWPAGHNRRQLALFAGVVCERGVVPVTSGALESQALGARHYAERKEYIGHVSLEQLANRALGIYELGRHDRHAQ